jgi:hypothetical protein
VPCASVAHPGHSVPGTAGRACRGHVASPGSLPVLAATDDGFGAVLVIGGVLDASDIEAVALDGGASLVPGHAPGGARPGSGDSRRHAPRHLAPRLRAVRAATVPPAAPRPLDILPGGRPRRAAKTA